jgi:hypothetical protein
MKQDHGRTRPLILVREIHRNNHLSIEFGTALLATILSSLSKRMNPTRLDVNFLTENMPALLVLSREKFVFDVVKIGNIG